MFVSLLQKKQENQALVATFED